MESEILWRLLNVLFILIVCAVFFFLGRAYEGSRMKGSGGELKRLRRQNEMMKKLSPKLKWGEDAKFKRTKCLSPLQKKDGPLLEVDKQGSP